MVALFAPQCTSQSILGIQAGDVTATSAAIWARGDRQSRMVVDFSTSPTFEWSVQTQRGPQVSAETDFTGTVERSRIAPRHDLLLPGALCEWIDGTIERDAAVVDWPLSHSTVHRSRPLDSVCLGGGHGRSGLGAQSQLEDHRL